MAKFKQTILDKIKADANLFACVATAMGIKPTTLASTIDRNGHSLNQYNVVVAVSGYLNQDASELLEADTIGAEAK